jgi:hypothetical protein
MVLYAVATLIYFAVFFDSRPWPGRVGRWVLVAACVAHAVDIATRDLQVVSNAETGFFRLAGACRHAPG